MSDQAAKHWDAAQPDPRQPKSCEKCKRPFWLGENILKPIGYCYPPNDHEALPLCPDCEEQEFRRDKEPKDIHLRMPWRDGRKTAWVRAANGKPLAEWAGDILDAAAEKRIAQIISA